MLFTFKFKPRMVLVSYHDEILMMFSTGGKRIKILISGILFTDWTSMLAVFSYINAYNLIYLFTFPIRISSIFIPRKIIVPKQSTYYDSIVILSFLYYRKSIIKMNCYPNSYSQWMVATFLSAIWCICWIFISSLTFSYILAMSAVLINISILDNISNEQKSIV